MPPNLNVAKKTMKENKYILLIYPRVGPYGYVFKDLPLSLLHLSSVAVSKGYEIKIFDQRISKYWESDLADLLDKNPLFAGLSVMSGYPIKYALQITKFIKKINKNIPIVWGGIHPTLLPEQTLKNESIDTVVRGDGENTLIELAEHFNGKKDINQIAGISYRNGNKIINNNDAPPLDLNIMPEIPYHLVDINKYFRVGFKEKTFSLLTSRYCPHKCTFCYSPSVGKNRWTGESAENIIKKISFIVETYKPDSITFLDDDFFVSIKKIKELFDVIYAKKVSDNVGIWKKLTFDFRGVRVDELSRMDDDFLQLLCNIGGKHLHIGAESGSQRMLNLMNKKITVEQTLMVNLKLRNFPSLIPSYNFFSGLPTETFDDLMASARLILQLIEENPFCQIVGFAQFTPWPGTELYNMSIKHGFVNPKNLEEWAEIDDANNARKLPWLSKKFVRKIELMYIAAFFIDNKASNIFRKNNFFGFCFYILFFIYKPIAKMRFAYRSNFFPLESFLMNKFILNIK